MYRGTTPTIVYEFPFGTEIIDKLTLTFVQGKKLILEKHLDDVVLEGNLVKVTFTEEETLMFDSDRLMVEMQFKIGVDGAVVASNIMRAEIARILNEGLLYGESVGIEPH